MPQACSDPAQSCSGGRVAPLLSFAVSQLPHQSLPAVTGLDKATAQKILKVWEETGAGSSPDALRKMLINRSIRTLGTVLLQVGLDTGPPPALPAPLCSSRRQPLPDVLMVARLCVQARPGAPSPRPGTLQAAATFSARSPWSTWPMRWGSTLASVRRVPPSAASAARGGGGAAETGAGCRRGAGRVPAGRDRLCGVPVLHQRGGLPAGRAPGAPWPATSLEGHNVCWRRARVSRESAEPLQVHVRGGVVCEVQSTPGERRWPAPSPRPGWRWRTRRRARSTSSRSSTR